MNSGIRLNSKKESALISWTFAKVKDPVRVRIPLAQFSGGLSEPCVKAGDQVKAGQVIALPFHPMDVAIHASISGKVTGVRRFPHPLFGEREAVEIECDEKNTAYESAAQERAGWDELSREQLKEIFRDSGLVEMDEDGIPLHWKMSDASPFKIRTLVINACESEPYVTSDYSLCMSHPVEILRGAEILRTAFSADRVVLAFEKEYHEAAELIKSKIYFLKWKHFEVHILPGFYPQSLAIPLMHSLFQLDIVPYYQELRAETPEELPPLIMVQTLHRIGISLHSPATAFAAYEAVVLQKPLYERAVAVAGECVIEPKVVWAPVGLSFQAVMKVSKGLMREPGRTLMGGPMRGKPQTTLEVPVLKNTKAILALASEVTHPGKVEPCIHCGDCVEHCPVSISPALITLAAEHEEFREAEEWGLATCIDCGNCTYVCPSKRPMADLIQYARDNAQRDKPRTDENAV